MRIRILALCALFSIVAACDGEDPPMATSIRITPSAASFTILGDTVQLTAEVLDENGNAMADNFTIQWSSSSPAVASVSSTGLVTAVGGGSTAITATTSGISGSANVAVDQSGSLRVQSARLATGRLTFPYQDALVGAGGEGAYSWSIASGQLPTGLSLATDGSITGTPTQEATVSFTAQVQDGAGATATKSLSVTVCPAPMQIALGQIVEGQAGPGTECGFFLPAGSAGDAYRVALVRLNSTDSGTLPDTLEMKAFGLVTGPAASPLSAAMEPGSFPRTRLEITPQMMEAIRVAERTEALHMRIREGERRLIATLDRSGLMPARPAALEAGGGALASANLRVDPPSTVDLTFPNIAATSCTGGTPDPATLRGFNDHLAIYESDANSPSVGQAEVDQILNYYRDYGHQVIQSYFGGTSDIDGDGRIVVLITPNVDDGTAAFVWSGDFFATTSCADSNVGEYVYFSPTTVAAIGDGNFQGLNTMVHEAKHVSSLFNRVSNQGGSPFHPGFIEEGTAEIAGEIAGRLSWAATGGPPVGAKVTDQDWQGQNAVTANSYGIFLRLARMVFYMSSQPNGVSASHTSRQGGIYGSGIMFHRWLADAYTNATTPFGDSDLFRLQNDSLTSGGTAAYPTLVGKSYTELLREYAKVVMMHGTGFEAPRTFTTYDLSTATEIFSLPDPAGTFPWPVTLTCGGAACPDDVDSRDPESLPDNDDRNVQAWMPFSNRTFDSPMGAGGIRVFEFQSGGTGDGVEITAIGTTQTKIYVSKIR